MAANFLMVKSFEFALVCGLFVCIWIQVQGFCWTFSCGTLMSSCLGIFTKIHVHTVEVQQFLVCLFSSFSECGLFLKLYAVLGSILALFGFTQIFCNRFQSL